MSLFTIETSFDRQVEFYKSEVVLFNRTNSAPFVPSVFPFAIPLMPDTPESLDTPKSSIVHSLMAAVCLSINEGHSFSKSIVVQPRRYTAHALTIRPSPVTRKLDTPTPGRGSDPEDQVPDGRMDPRLHHDPTSETRARSRTGFTAEERVLSL